MVRRIVLAFMVAALVGAMTSSTAHAAGGYTFTKVFDSAMGFDPFEFGCAALNDLGDVAVRATSTSGTTAIFLVSDTGTIRIADNRRHFALMGRNPSVNNARQVSFAANLQTGEEGIFRGGVGGLVPIAGTAGAFNFFTFDTSLSDSGVVAFRAEVDSNDEGLFSGDGLGAVTTHYLESTSEFSGDSRPSINSAGHIAFAARLDLGGEGIFAVSQGGVSVISANFGPIDSTENPSLNDNGFAVFSATLDSGGHAIIAETSGVPSIVATTRGAYRFFGTFGPSINTQGDVAFTAELDAGGQGLFTGSDAVADRVVGTGDPLDGSSLINVSMCAEGLNDSGQLAFTAQLADGRTAVFRAEPPA